MNNEQIAKDIRAAIGEIEDALADHPELEAEVDNALVKLRKAACDALGEKRRDNVIGGRTGRQPRKRAY